MRFKVIAAMTMKITVFRVEEDSSNLNIDATG
jgi:hypothetical protein